MHLLKFDHAPFNCKSVEASPEVSKQNTCLGLGKDFVKISTHMVSINVKWNSNSLKSTLSCKKWDLIQCAWSDHENEPFEWILCKIDSHNEDMLDHLEEILHP